METATMFRSSLGIRYNTSPPYVSVRSAILWLNGPDFLQIGYVSKGSPALVKQQSFAFCMKLCQRRVALDSRRCTTVRASMSSSSDSEGSTASIAPLLLESPVGQFLSHILISHPHLFPAAVEHQLEQLQTDRDSEKQKEEPSASSTDLELYRRIVEVKANERRKALEETLYALIVQQFMDANVYLIPFVARSASLRVDTWPSQDEKLDRLHSSEAYYMIRNLLDSIVRTDSQDSDVLAQISKLQVGQVYVASIMYGYFLKRVEQRLQLEKKMKDLPQSHTEVSLWSGGGISPGGFGHEMKYSRLQAYVSSFDRETLERYATIRSKEAITIIERHTQALFRLPDIVLTPDGTIDSSKDELIFISGAGKRKLVLEAVAFGSLLWDVESYVDSRYHFIAN